MKNSKWRDYGGAGRILRSEDVPAVGETRREGAQGEKSKLRSQFWKCTWCAVLNAIGASICDRCGMPRLE